MFVDLGGVRSQQFSDRQLFTVRDYFAAVLDECTNTIYNGESSYPILSKGLIFSMGSYFGFCADSIMSLMIDDYYGAMWYGNFSLVVLTVKLIRDLKMFHRFLLGCDSTTSLLNNLHVAFNEGTFGHECVEDVAKVWHAIRWESRFSIRAVY